ncbi:Putative GTP cyclohydrolase 1 type 2, NIF3 family [Halalkaliarchaeum sp. AArc-CO]|uniref:Nif3-like dinuclear metal center hexameric protein n=1 Tax=unclassified Halalkaliarchaeum TaxID=2678344 RepID=UPI00217E915E|nr:MULTISPECIES: Nif3-like dinuclear metal center hexameric protein [unclassified Halalkaliarchaeum]MDR5674439.1 Nif3-like dinuclear metal center hexameric protein [Halalkaliarchaeum sp. AArc-GB]UWG51938.1 Putative GTP cyclohydrolase 1 type 2, NIF3 family [Halalkaliarchaeum sp. AArc-CO]
MRLSEFAAKLDDRLDTEAYADVDASANGLQVGPSPDAGAVGNDPVVDHAAFAVDAAMETIEAAADAGADVLVTHHGLVWGGLDRITGSDYARLAPLVEGDLALYVSHLPLDGHQELGNAAGIADLLGVTDRAPFGELGGEYIGIHGEIPGGTSTTQLAETLETELDTGSGDVRLLDFGPANVSDVAIVTGSGTDWLGEAVAAGVDVLVTGEGKGKVYHEAREAGISVVLAGHYATETFGVRALQDVVDGWGIETTYLGHPTGL